MYKNLNNRHGNVETYLLNYGKKIKDKHQILKEELDQQKNNFDFKPKINKLSEMIVRQ